jgi:hypothetical protein
MCLLYGKDVLSFELRQKLMHQALIEMNAQLQNRDYALNFGNTSMMGLPKDPIRIDEKIVDIVLLRLAENDCKFEKHRVT